MRAQGPPLPLSGSDSFEASRPAQSAQPPDSSSSQDEVKLQWDSTENIPIYQFVNQQGTLILQIPSQQLLDIAQAISDELAQEASAKTVAATEGGKK